MSVRERLWIQIRSRVYEAAIELRKNGWFWPAVAITALVLIGLIILLWPVIWFLLKLVFFIIVGILAIALIIYIFCVCKRLLSYCFYC